MASKSNLISAFRQAVQSMQDAYEKALGEAELADALGWGEAELASEFSSSSDISAGDLIAAMNVIKGIDAANSGIAGVLSKMRA